MINRAQLFLCSVWYKMNNDTQRNRNDTNKMLLTKIRCSASAPVLFTSSVYFSLSLSISLTLSLFLHVALLFFPICLAPDRFPVWAGLGEGEGACASMAWIEVKRDPFPFASTSSLVVVVAAVVLVCYLNYFGLLCCGCYRIVCMYNKLSTESLYKYYCSKYSLCRRNHMR